jgi:hypothetical protein
MKKFLAAFGLMAGLIVLAGTAKAATTGTFTLRVTPNDTPSITVSTGLVTMNPTALGGSVVSNSSVTVTNVGTIGFRIGLRILTPDSNGWTDQAGNVALTQDRYNVRALFNAATAPAVGAFGAAVTTNDVRSTGVTLATTGGAYAGTESGQSVPPTGTNVRGLWLRMDLPPTSSVAGAHDPILEVSAN